MELEDPNLVDVAELSFPSLSELVDPSDLVVTATVVAVSEPRWNSASGGRFQLDYDRELPITPRQIRFATVEIGAIHKSSGTLAKGEQLEILVWGSGQPADSVIIFDVLEHPVTLNKLSGEFAVGQRKLLVLQSMEVPFFDAEKSPNNFVVLSHYYQGNWTYGPDGLRSLDPLRAVANPQLLVSLIQDRADGGTRLDQIEARTSTARIPLGAPPAEVEELLDVTLRVEGGVFWCEGADCSPASRSPSPLPPPEPAVPALIQP